MDLHLAPFRGFFYCLIPASAGQAIHSSKAGYQLTRSIGMKLDVDSS